jgi:F0F1-type ATP synthase membrane subunit b/b'
VFIAILLWKKVPGLITRGLEKQIAAIRTRLDEAAQLRAEAERCATNMPASSPAPRPKSPA